MLGSFKLNNIIKEVMLSLSIQRDKFYQSITSYVSLVSITLFFFLSFFFPLSRMMILSYYLKSGFFYGFSVIVIIVSGSVLSGLLTSYLFNKFLYKSIKLFLIIYIVFFVLFYYFMLAESSFSFFIYAEMNGIFDALLNAYTLYITIVLSAFLIIQAKESLNAGFGTGGIIAALFSLGCPSCGALLWSLVGLGGLSFLPFHGFELRFLSLLILGWATFETYKAINFKDKKIEVKFKLD